jgi:hypothetical protein
MRKLIVRMGVSLDGLVARPGRYGAGGWGTPPEDPALKQVWLGLASAAEADPRPTRTRANATSLG